MNTAIQNTSIRPQNRKKIASKTAIWFHLSTSIMPSETTTLETPGALKAEVKTFWNRQSCGTGIAHSQKFSREYFKEVEAWRYSDQPFVHSFAQFTRYHGKRVLEVGFGAGADFVQWLRAGALASGVDLTEEALANLTQRIRIYSLPQPQSLQVADAEKLPFPDNSFDLGYSWGVLHHT